MTPQRTQLVGRVLTGLVALVLILAGVLKLLDVGAEDMVEGLRKANLIQHQTLISSTAIVCGLLLVIPLTQKVGWLMASAYWGGAIVAHLTYNDSIIMPASFLVMLWVGVFCSHRNFRADNAEPQLAPKSEQNRDSPA